MLWAPNLPPPLLILHLWLEENFELWESGNWSVGERRILMTHWVYKAFERVHLEHKDAIISCFKNVGLSQLSTALKITPSRYETYRISRSATGNEPLKGLQRTPLLSMTMTILRIQLRSTTTRRASYILRGRWKKASQSRKRERRMS